MATSQTSRDAYKEILPELGDRQLLVLRALRTIGPASNNMIANYLNLPINIITPRVNELRNLKKLVGYSHTGTDPITKKKVMFWKVLDRKLNTEENIWKPK